MAGPPSDPRPGPPDEPIIPGAGYAEEGLDIETPRRAASAQFVVDADVGSEAALRDAMDPANQSLAEALRLSFRVLQLVIIVLVVLFIFSGVQTVDEGESGVRTAWGRIVAGGGQEALDPGLRWSPLPYPAGEFIIFPVKNREASVGNNFWPDIQGVSRAVALERSNTTQALRPGKDGYFLTRDGDLGHVRMTASYEIDDPVGFVERIRPEAGVDAQADHLVELALDRAIIHVTAGMTLQDVIDLGDSGKEAVQIHAQRMLDDLDSGIRLINLSLPEKPSAPFGIEKSLEELQEATVFAQDLVERAYQDAEDTLSRAVGGARVLVGDDPEAPLTRIYTVILDLIDRYEDALELGDDAEADTLLAQINDLLDSDEVAGQVAQVISRARSYESKVAQDLGTEAQRFRSLLPAFRETPNLVIAERWMDAYAAIITRPDAEPFYVPTGMHMALGISGRDEIAEIRRKMLLALRERQAQEAATSFFDLSNYGPLRAEDYNLDGPGRQFKPGGLDR